MPKDNMHHDNAEHRDIHNLYGTMYHEATAQGLIGRGTAVNGKDGDRPFVLSRAFFAGTQVSTVLGEAEEYLLLTPRTQHYVPQQMSKYNDSQF